MIRQAVFNMLAADLPGAEFYDVFAGTGVVGLEAISRGAVRAVFIERERRQAALIERNVAHLGVQSQANVRLADAFLWARHFSPGAGAVVVYLGPPYDLCQGDRLPQLLEMVAIVQSKLRPGDVLALQFSKRATDEALPGGPGWYRLRQYGKTRIGLWTPPTEATHKDSAADDAPTG
jgi:16S rRNA (guanine(966)-N(2))-methyltransferase RsmD